MKRTSLQSMIDSASPDLAVHQYFGKLIGVVDNDKTL